MPKSEQGVEQFRNAHSIGAAVDFLEGNLKDIRDVKTWAEEMGYSRSHFSIQVKEHLGKNPSEVLVEVRVKQIYKKILAHPRKNSYSVARMVGLKDDDALCQFLSYHFDTNYTELKEKLLSSKGA